MNHEKIIKQQLLDQTIIEESEYGNAYGDREDLEPAIAAEIFEQFIEQRYIYGQEEIPIGKRKSGIKATKIA